MSLGEPIHVRLPLEMQQNLEKEAAFKNQTLSQYLREKLKEAEDLHQHVSKIRREIEYLSMSFVGSKSQSSGNNEELLEEMVGLKNQIEGLKNSSPSQSAVNNDQGILLEILLLLRQIAQSERVQIAQKELSRLGIETWTST